MATRSTPCSILCGAAVLLLASGCDHEAGAGSVGEAPPGATVSLADAPLAAFRSDLLELAFETATAIPVEPHLKDRSRAQEAVVAACLELDQPRRARGCIERIDNWRRSAAYGDLAFYCAQRRDSGEAHRCLTLAGQTSEGLEDWRRDRVAMKIARTLSLLRQTQQADRLETEAGAFDEQMIALQAMVATGQFDVTRSALESYAELFDRFYEDQPRRALVQGRIRSSWDILPIFVRIELLMALADSALDHADQVVALALVQDAQHLLDSAQWPMDYHTALTANLAALRFRAGDQSRARSDADAALAAFDARRHEITDIDRAGVLRTLAEARQAMGDTDAALTLYRRAVEAGVENPNSRPRAQDLSATCCSMALHDVEPDAELWSRIHQVKQGLGHPW